jgi:predicted metal-dependent enzyme (double-stranded beta helix superfamily)
MQLRLLLEPTAARLAASRLADQHLRRLEELCRVRGAPGDPSNLPAVEAHRELHLIVARESGNLRLADTLAKLYDDVERLIHLGVSRIGPEEMAGYRPLVAALAAGDGEMAARLMVEQIELGRKRILEALLSGASQPEPEIRNGAAPGVLELNDFAAGIAALLPGANPAEVPLRVAEQLPRLLHNPRLLSPEQRASSSQTYRRHVLFVDPEGRFSILALVWEAGQATPVHNHPCWSVAGVYTGELRETAYRKLDDSGGNPRLISTGVSHYHQGDVLYLNSLDSNLHRLDNPTEKIAISIHIFGTDVRNTGSTFGQCYLPEDLAPA